MKTADMPTVRWIRQEKSWIRHIMQSVVDSVRNGSQICRASLCVISHHANYDDIPWVNKQKSIMIRLLRHFVRFFDGNNVNRIRVNSRDSECNAPGKEVSKSSLTAGTILKEEKMLSFVGGKAKWEEFRGTIWARIIASQTCHETVGSQFFAVRQWDLQSVSLWVCVCVCQAFASLPFSLLWQGVHQERT